MGSTTTILATPTGAGGNPIPVSAANPLPVNATVNATASAVATAAAPSYGEGTTQSLSMDLAGSLRIGGTISASSSIKSTAADPSYSEGVTTNPLSCDLTGYQRVKAKQSGTWTTAIDQTTPGTTNLIDCNNLPDTVDVNSGNKSNSTIRVVEATDAPAQAARGTAATGAAVPSGAVYLGASVAGTLTGLVATANGLKVDGSAVTQPVSIATAPVLVAGAAIIGKVGIDQTTPGTTNAVAVTNLPTTVDTNSGNKSASTLRTLIATDAVAVPLWGHGTPAATAPTGLVQQGVRGATANPSAVTDAQSVVPMADKVGRQVVVHNGVRDLILTPTVTLTATVTETTLQAAVASTFLDLLSIRITNSSATAATVSVRDDTAGTVRFSIIVPAGEFRGFVLQTPHPQTAVNKNWTVQSSASVSSLIIDAQFVKNI